MTTSHESGNGETCNDCLFMGRTTGITFQKDGAMLENGVFLSYGAFYNGHLFTKRTIAIHDGGVFIQLSESGMGLLGCKKSNNREEKFQNNKETPLAKPPDRSEEVYDAAELSYAYETTAEESHGISEDEDYEATAEEAHGISEDEDYEATAEESLGHIEDEEVYDAMEEEAARSEGASLAISTSHDCDTTTKASVDDYDTTTGRSRATVYKNPKEAAARYIVIDDGVAEDESEVEDGYDCEVNETARSVAARTIVIDDGVAEDDSGVEEGCYDATAEESFATASDYGATAEESQYDSGVEGYQIPSNPSEEVKDGYDSSSSKTTSSSETNELSEDRMSRGSVTATSTKAAGTKAAAKNAFSTSTNAEETAVGSEEAEAGSFGGCKACGKADLSIVQLLLDSGANIEAKDDRGKTLLHHACSKGDSSLVQLLLDRGANVEAKDDQGKTPLHHACVFGEETGGSEEEASGINESLGLEEEEVEEVVLSEETVVGLEEVEEASGICESYGSDEVGHLKVDKETKMMCAEWSDAEKALFIPSKANENVEPKAVELKAAEPKKAVEPKEAVEPKAAVEPKEAEEPKEAVERKKAVQPQEAASLEASEALLDEKVKSIPLTPSKTASLEPSETKMVPPTSSEMASLEPSETMGINASFDDNLGTGTNESFDGCLWMGLDDKENNKVIETRLEPFKMTPLSPSEMAFLEPEAKTDVDANDINPSKVATSSTKALPETGKLTVAFGKLLFLSPIKISKADN